MTTTLTFIALLMAFLALILAAIALIIRITINKQIAKEIKRFDQELQTQLERLRAEKELHDSTDSSP